MSARGRMVGSWCDYCIFRTAEGLFVRLETRAYSMRGGRPVCKRTYTTINKVPVQTDQEAQDIIQQVLNRGFDLALGIERAVQ